MADDDKKKKEDEARRIAARLLGIKSDDPILLEIQRKREEEDK